MELPFEVRQARQLTHVPIHRTLVYKEHQGSVIFEKREDTCQDELDLTLYLFGPGTEVEI